MKSVVLLACVAACSHSSSVPHVRYANAPVIHVVNDRRDVKRKPTELVFYPREGHGISEYYHVKDRLMRIYDWVTRYTLGSGKTTTQ